MLKGGVKRKNSKFVAKSKNKNPNAAEIETELRNSKNFGGIFTDKQLKNIIILKYPVILLVIVKNHWLVLYLDKSTIELYDSLMNICEYSHVLKFIRNNSFDKQLKIFPKVQADNNTDCSFFAMFFIKAKTNKILFDELLSMFSCNFKNNADIVRTAFNTKFFHQA